MPVLEGTGRQTSSSGFHANKIYIVIKQNKKNEMANYMCYLDDMIIKH